MNPRNILGHAVVRDTERERALRAGQAPAAETFCCGPCSKGQHDRCLADQPCDCPGCARARMAAVTAQTAGHDQPSGLPSRGALRERGRQGTL